MTPLLYYSSYIPHFGSPKHWFCTWDSDATNKCLTVLVCLISFVPMSVICFVQTLTYRELQRSSRQFGENSQRIRTMKKVLRTFTIIAAVFFLLTTPLCVFSLLYFWALENINISKKTAFDLYKSFILIMTINSCANPVIYSRIHTKVFQLITRIIQNRRRATNNNNNIISLHSNVTFTSKVSVVNTEKEELQDPY